MNTVSDAGLIGKILNCGSLEAESLLQNIGGLSGLTEQQHLDRLPQISASIELVARIMQSEMKTRTELGGSKGARDMVQTWLRTEPQEVFCVAFFDTRHRLIAAEKMFFGTIDGSEVHPREVLRRAIALNAAAIVIAHNHPSGIADPSAADRQITRRLQEALSLIDVRVLDHFIVAGNSTYSFAEHGLL